MPSTDQFAMPLPAPGNSPAASPRWSGLRIVHAANYQLKKDGSVFFNCDHKFHQGMVQCGSYVYPFSINDRSRMLSVLGSKNFGKRRMNRALLETCLNVHADVLMLGHAQLVTRETIAEIREALPDIRVGLWYVDPVWAGAPVEHIHNRLDLLDAVFVTTGGDLLQQFHGPRTTASFIPNPADISIERYRAFDVDQPLYDLVFFGRDKNEPERRRFLERLVGELPEARIGLFGCLGNPLVFGFEKEAILRSSRMALNLSRRNDIPLYSSDRVVQTTGNGLLTLSAAACGLDALYSDQEMVFYSSFDDAIARIRELLGQDDLCREIARRGWQKTHEHFSAARIADFMLDILTSGAASRPVLWSEQILPAAASSETVSRLSA